MAEEKNFENKVKMFLKERGCYFIKYWGGGNFTKSGVPDILCCWNGRFVGIELKAQRGKPSELQLWNLKQIEKAGGLAFLLYPDEFEKFRGFIEFMKTDGITSEKIYQEIKGW